MSYEFSFQWCVCVCFGSMLNVTAYGEKEVEESHVWGGGLPHVSCY